MALDQHLGFPAVPALDGIHHRHMLLHALRHIHAQTHGAIADPLLVVGVVVHPVQQDLVAHHLQDGNVKLLIQLKIFGVLSGVDGSLHLPADLPQRRHLGIRGIFRHLTDGRLLHDLAGLVNVPDLLPGDIGDPEFPSVGLIDQSLTLQTDQRLPNRGAADAVLRRKLLHHQELTGHHTQRHDLGLQRGVDLFHNGFSLLFHATSSKKRKSLLDLFLYTF